jgi:hypothetical protein
MRRYRSSDEEIASEVVEMANRSKREAQSLAITFR